MDHDHLTHRLRRRYSAWRYRHGVSETDWQDIAGVAAFVLLIGAILVLR